MAFMARIKELGKSIAGVDETDEINIIDENDMDESQVKEVIMIDPRAMELLKVLTGFKKDEEEVEKGISDTNDASPKKNGLGIYKADSKGKAPTQKRSLEDMTEILGKKSTERADDL